VPDRWAAVAAALAVLLAAGIGAVAVGTSAPGESTASGPALDPTGQVAAIHDDGVTGENVTVGVVDVTRFDGSNDALAERVTAARAFDDGHVWTRGGPTHGTATAAVVADVAPDADLRLASVDDGESFRRAVEWLVASDADVIVAPVSAYGKPDDASGEFARAASWASRQGTVVVAPTGNLGRSHWTATYDGDGVVEYRDGGDENYLVGDEREVRVWLSWPRAAANEDYAVELYGTNGEEAWLVAESGPYPDGVPNERLAATIDPRADHFVVVRGPENATETRLSLSSPTHEFEHRQRRGSVASPAVAEPVVAVGAYGPKSRVSEPYSSAGRLPDGHLGVDVLGPAKVDAPGVPEDFEGTSVSAAYVGGVAALIRDANPELGSDGVHDLLVNHVDDAGVDGADPLAGYGRADPRQAVAVARNATA